MPVEQNCNFHLAALSIQLVAQKINSGGSKCCSPFGFKVPLAEFFNLTNSKEVFFPTLRIKGCTVCNRFLEQVPPPKLCQASAGSDLIGCHSAALDVDGRLYTWGVGVAAGHASLKPVLLPRYCRENKTKSTDIVLLA